MASCSNCRDFPRRSDHHEALYTDSACLRRLRTSNLAATEEEVAQVRTFFLPSVVGDIAAINASIDALDETLRLMEKERKKLIRIKKRFKALISPRRNVPLEIWSEIFVHAHQMNVIEEPLPDHTDIFNARAHRAVQWAVGQVCRTWRNAILSTHQLWSKIFIYFPANIAIPRAEERLEMVLRRSGRHPLRLKLADSDPPGNQVSVNARRDKLMDHLYAESYRWESACFVRFCDSMFPRLQGCLPLLETLAIHSPCTDTQPEEIPAITGFSVCPRLSNVAISGDEKDIDLPWAQIRTLDVAIHEDASRWTALYRCLRLAEKCHNLEQLIVGTNTMEYAPEVDDPDYMLTSPTIQRVVTMYEFILDHLTLPQLQSAMLANPAGDHRDPPLDIERLHILSSFYNLLRRSNCTNITNLELWELSSYGEGEFILDILTWTRNLTTLKLRVTLKIIVDDEQVPDIVGIGELDKIMARLSPRHKPTFLPCIHDFDISILEHPESSHFLYFGENDGTFVETLQTRWKADSGVSKLKKFHFDLEADHLADTAARRPPESFSSGLSLLTREEHHSLYKLYEDGMDLSILVTSRLAGTLQRHTILQIPQRRVPEHLWL